MKNPARKESVQSSAFCRHHSVVHVSAIMHILLGYRGTYIWGYVLSWHCSRQKISIKNERYLFSDGYLFTGFNGIWIRNDPYKSNFSNKRIEIQQVFVGHCVCLILRRLEQSGSLRIEKELTAVGSVARNCT